MDHPARPISPLRVPDQRIDRPIEGWDLPGGLGSIPPLCLGRNMRLPLGTHCGLAGCDPNVRGYSIFSSRCFGPFLIALKYLNKTVST